MTAQPPGTPPSPDDDDPVLYQETVRDLDTALLVGEAVVGLTQHDKDEYVETGRTYTELHFTNGMILRILGCYEVERPTGEFVTVGPRYVLEDDEE